MQKTNNAIATKNYTLTFTKESGNLWILKDFDPLGKSFERFFEENLGHDIGKLMICGCANYIPSIPRRSSLKQWIVLD